MAPAMWKMKRNKKGVIKNCLQLCPFAGTREELGGCKQRLSQEPHPSGHPAQHVSITGVNTRAQGGAGWEGHQMGPEVREASGGDTYTQPPSPGSSRLSWVTPLST